MSGIAPVRNPMFASTISDSHVEWLTADCFFKRAHNGKYDVGVNKIEVIVAIPPVEVYLKIKDERITDEIKINVDETKQIKVIHFCFATTSRCNLK